MGILSPSVFRGRERSVGRDGFTITLDIWYPYGRTELTKEQQLSAQSYVRFRTATVRQVLDMSPHS